MAVVPESWAYPWRIGHIGAVEFINPGPRASYDQASILHFVWPKFAARCENWPRTLFFWRKGLLRVDLGIESSWPVWSSRPVWLVRALFLLAADSDFGDFAVHHIDGGADALL